jgi:hypothetical protein
MYNPAASRLAFKTERAPHLARRATSPVAAGRADEQRQVFTALRALVLERGFRIKVDPEGWAYVPARYGRLEHHCDGRSCHGCPEPGPLLAVWTDRPRLFAKLWAIPGIWRWQTGDSEMRAIVPIEAFEQVASVIRVRRRRTLSPEAARQRGAATAYRATSAMQEAVCPNGLGLGSGPAVMSRAATLPRGKGGPA